MCACSVLCKVNVHQRLLIPLEYDLHKTAHLDLALTLAPWSISNFTMSAYPPDAASIRGVESPVRVHGGEGGRGGGG